jgi:hypothetical protein
VGRDWQAAKAKAERNEANRRRKKVDRALRGSRNQDFGNGEVGGNRNWTPPTYGITDDDRPITFSLGLGPREGETLASSGHKGILEFYDHETGHDHYGPDGETGRNGDRNQWY